MCELQSILEFIQGELFRSIDMLLSGKPEDVACVLHFALLHAYQLLIGMDPVVPDLYHWTEVALWSENLVALLLCMNPNLGHLFVQLDDHQAQPS